MRGVPRCRREQRQSHLAQARGQHEVYLAKQIRAFRSGERKDPTMAPMVSILKEEDIDDVAAYYASQTPK